MVQQVPPPIAAPDLARLPDAAVEAMHDAAAEVLTCQRVLAKGGDSLVGEVLRGAPEFVEWGHYPDGDAHDHGSRSQWYYHAHAAADRVEGEHGHFHLFRRLAEAPPAREGVEPSAREGVEPSAREGVEPVCHLVGVSLDAWGRALRLFTVNRWVTAEIWHDAAAVESLLAGFDMDIARPSWPVNRWLTAMVRLYHPHIAALAADRDSRVAAWAAAHPGADVHEDRGLQVTSWLPVDILADITAIERRLGL